MDATSFMIQLGRQKKNKKEGKRVAAEKRAAMPAKVAKPEKKRKREPASGDEACSEESSGAMGLNADAYAARSFLL